MPEMEAFVNERIDSVFEKGETDLHELLSVSLPMFVIFRLLGIERYDEDGTDRFEWTRDGIVNSVGLMLVPPGEVAQMIESGNIEQVRMQNLVRTNELFVKQLAETKSKLASGEWQGRSEPGDSFFSPPPGQTALF